MSLTNPELKTIEETRVSFHQDFQTQLFVSSYTIDPTNCNRWSTTENDRHQFSVRRENQY